VAIPAGASRVTFPVFGARPGVEEFSAQPSDSGFDTAFARVQVSPLTALHLEISSGDQQLVGAGPLAAPVILRAVDQNRLGYPGVRVTASASAGGTVEPSIAISDPDGFVTFRWTAAQGRVNALDASIEGAPAGGVTVTALGPPVILPGGVVNAASFQPRIAPGTLVSIFGGSLAAGRTAAAPSSSALPATLAGVQVKINGSPAPLVYVSDRQVNFLAPATLLPGPAEIVIQTSLGTSAPFAVQFEQYAPAIFFNVPARIVGGEEGSAGLTLTVYCTGFDSIVPRPAPTPAPRAAVLIDGVETPELGLVSFPRSSGVQVLIALMRPLPPGSHDLAITLHGIVSNTVKIHVPPGN
jgi:uncharacterized protein (TIGR03437 family)